MKKISLEEKDVDVIWCPSCQKYKSIAQRIYKIKVAINDEDKNTQNDVQFYSHYLVICNACRLKIFKKDKK